ncbi:MAG: DUF5333 domain-containing protein [Roseinatronobacter sp.]
MKKTVLATVLASVVAGSAAAAVTQADVNDTLRNTPVIYNGLFTAALIKHITDTCPAIAPPGRIARVNFFLGLYNRARGLGFSRAQIEAFVEDKSEQARMRGTVKQHLRRAGVDPDDEAAVCAHARAEIAGRTALGRQLRER